MSFSVCTSKAKLPAHWLWFLPAAVVHSGQHDHTSLLTKTISMGSWPDGDMRDVFKDFSHSSIWHARILLPLNPHKGTGNRHQRSLELLMCWTRKCLFTASFHPISIIPNKPYSQLFIIHSESECGVVTGSSGPYALCELSSCLFTRLHSLSQSLASKILWLQSFCFYL